MMLVLLVSTLLLLGSVLSYSMAMVLLVHLVVRLTSSDSRVVGFWKSVAVMMIVTLQIALWAVAVLLCGEMATFERAFYYSAETYTALGYGDIVLSQRWRLLGPLEAINGLLLFGLSTAVMFAVMSRLITDRLRLQPDQAAARRGSGRAEDSLSGSGGIDSTN
jgi:hypothetical protein